MWNRNSLQSKVDRAGGRHESSTRRRPRPRLVVLAAALIAAIALLMAPRAPLPVARAAGCTVSWTAAVSGNWTDATNWSTGQAPVSSDDVCITQTGSPYTVTLIGTASVNSVQTGGSATLTLTTNTSGAGANLTAATGFTNNGTISLINTAGGACSNFAFAPDVLTVTSGTLTNAGTINLAENCAGFGAELNGNLTNNGTVNVTGPATFPFRGNTYTNNATFDVSSSGSLTMSGNSTFVQAGGTLTVDGALTANGLGAFNFAGGTITGANQPVVQVGMLIAGTGTGGVTVLEVNTLHGGSTISGDIGPNETITLATTATGLAAQLTAATGFTNNGTITLLNTPGAACANSAFGADQLTLTSGTLTNVGAINIAENCAGVGARLDANLTNNGTVNVTGPSNVANISGYTYTNNAAFNIASSGALTMGGNTFVQGSGGTLEFGIASATSFGRLTSASSITLAGTVDPALQAGFLPTTAEKFEVIDGPHTGTFATVQQGFTAQYLGANAGGCANASGCVLLVAGAATPLAITTTSLPNGQVGQTYPLTTLQATGALAPYTWSLAPGSSLPAGLSLSTSGAISGTPTTAGTVKFSVQAADAETPPVTVTAQLSITITPALLVITTTTLPSGQINQAYPVTSLAATGGTTPYTWSLVTGSSLPAGLALNSSTGAISGVPTAAGTTNFPVQVSDAEATPQVVSKQLSITIAPPPLAITTTSLPGGKVGQAYPSTTLAATGGTTPYSWSLASGALPAGLSLDSSKGAISGTPTAAGTANFTVQVTDAEATPQNATAPLSITVAPTRAARAYVANYMESGASNSDSLTVIDTATNRVTDTIAAVGNFPTAVAASPDGTTLYVANDPFLAAEGGVTVIDTASDTVRAIIPLAFDSRAITVAPDGSKVFAAVNVGNKSGGAVVIDAATNQVTATIDLGTDPSAIATSPDGTKLYVANPFANTISVIDTATNQATSTITVEPPSTTGYYGLAVSRDGTNLYVSSDRSGSVFVIDTTTNQITATIPVGPGLASDALSPDGSTLYVAGGQSSKLSIIDTTTNRVTATVSLGYIVQPGDVAVTPDGARVYVPTPNGVIVVDTATNTVISTIPIGSVVQGIAIAVPGTVVTPEPLSVGTTSLPDGVFKGQYTAAMTPLGGTPPYAWSLSSGRLPASLSLNASTGVIGGNPLVVGTTSFTVEIRDSSSPVQTATASFSITISRGGNGGAPLTVTTTSLRGGTVGQRYQASLVATGGRRPYSWSLTSGTLPAGLSLDAARGVISGTPTGAGIADFSVTVTDSSNPAQTATASLSISIAAATTQITISPAFLFPALRGRVYSAQLSASGGAGPYTFAVTAGALPRGLALSTSGTLSGTATLGGSFSFTVTATDSAGNTGTKQYVLVILSFGR